MMWQWTELTLLSHLAARRVGDSRRLGTGPLRALAHAGKDSRPGSPRLLHRIIALVGLARLATVRNGTG
ncbi:hypothetical protein GCM10010254_71020 [Streptomyces chromofuscus]|nr:hypothetical protein GCM10010254_71020 [Streptomyces chromofuscus]